MEDSTMIAVAHSIYADRLAEAQRRRQTNDACGMSKPSRPHYLRQFPRVRAQVARVLLALADRLTLPSTSAPQSVTIPAS